MNSHVRQMIRAKRRRDRRRLKRRLKVLLEIIEKKFGPMKPVYEPDPCRGLITIYGLVNNSPRNLVIPISCY